MKGDVECGGGLGRDRRVGYGVGRGLKIFRFDGVINGRFLGPNASQFVFKKSGGKREGEGRFIIFENALMNNPSYFSKQKPRR